jgi:hypothetical protein
MGATHVVNHREDLEAQVKALNLNVPIRYILHPSLSYCRDLYVSKANILIIADTSTWSQGRSNISKS